MKKKLHIYIAIIAISALPGLAFADITISGSSSSASAPTSSQSSASATISVSDTSSSSGTDRSISGSSAGVSTSGSSSSGSTSTSGSSSSGTPDSSGSSSSGTPNTGGSSSSGTPNTSGSGTSSSPDTSGSSSTGTPNTSGSSSTGTPDTSGSSSSGTPNTSGSSPSGTPNTSGSSSSGTPNTSGSSSSGTPNTSGSTSSGSSGSYGGTITIIPGLINPPTTPVTPNTPDGNNNTSGNTSGGYSYSSGGGFVGLQYLGSCTLLKDYMRYGIKNDPTEVTKLQLFLKNNQKINLNVTGVFDRQTEEAVKKFQIRYWDTTMKPWGATIASGYVYITTLKKINQIACNQPLTLNSSELATIEAFDRNWTANHGKIASAGTADTETPASQIEPATVIKDVEVEVTFEGPTPTPGSDSNILTENQDQSSNEANVGKANILHKFWKFMGGLFR